MLQPVSPPEPEVAEARTTGFPSPATDYRKRRLDITAYLVRNPAATFLFKARGDALARSGIHDGDILVVDKSVEPRPGQVVVVFGHGERLVKRLVGRAGRLLLVSDDPLTPALELRPDGEFTVWGVVVGTFKRVPA
ncbi:LexA family protein [Crenobacter cavernae]|uniref:LexA family protein n=1 Tax=Crenobacter cavernae TaxID=2290923 RepID=UPI001C696532|nr:S24 family peptidase [Crenobacter cavernae]